MLRRALIAAVAAVAFAAPVAAQTPGQCIPLVKIDQRLTELGIGLERLWATQDVEFVNTYHKAAGIEFPDGAQPVGMFLIAFPDRVLVALVEKEDGGYCTRWSTSISHERHKIAFTAASRSV